MRGSKVIAKKSVLLVVAGVSLALGCTRQSPPGLPIVSSGGNCAGLTHPTWCEVKANSDPLLVGGVRDIRLAREGPLSDGVGGFVGADVCVTIEAPLEITLDVEEVLAGPP